MSHILQPQTLLGVDSIVSPIRPNTVGGFVRLPIGFLGVAYISEQTQPLCFP
jgi:hypothetical protein